MKLYKYTSEGYKFPTRGLVICTRCFLLLSMWIISHVFFKILRVSQPAKGLRTPWNKTRFLQRYIFNTTCPKLYFHFFPIALSCLPSVKFISTQLSVLGELQKAVQSGIGTSCCQTWVASSKSHIAWIVVSISLPQRSQIGDSRMFHCHNRPLVFKRSCASNQRDKDPLEGPPNLHKAFQLNCSSLTVCWFSSANTDLVVKMSLDDEFHHGLQSILGCPSQRMPCSSSWKPHSIPCHETPLLLPRWDSIGSNKLTYFAATCTQRLRCSQKTTMWVLRVVSYSSLLMVASQDLLIVWVGIFFSHANGFVDCLCFVSTQKKSQLIFSNWAIVQLPSLQEFMV